MIENAQRDLNIAFMNELSAIFQKLDIDTGDVLAAARTKWNFQNFYPGLVGGHCIGVDPYYLTYRAEKAGYHPEVILAGRRINDGVGQRIASECIRMLCEARSPDVCRQRARPDVQGKRPGHAQLESRRHCPRALRMLGSTVQVGDPWASAEEARHEYGIELIGLDAMRPADAVILAVAHEQYVEGGWPLVTRLLKRGEGVVLDVKGLLDRGEMPQGIDLWRL